MSRPIPFNRITTFFWSNDGTSPEWFTNDTAPVETCKLPSIELGLEWVQRRQSAGREVPRVIASDANGTMYWLHEQHGPIPLNAFGNPDFTSMMSAY